jgi:putative endonuclease
MARRAEPLRPLHRPRREKIAAFRLGLSAESRAAMVLLAKGYRILARRWKTPFGEIDIVARRRATLVFVEVKARERADDAAEAVTDATSAGSSPPPSFGLPAIRRTRRARSVSTWCW